MPLLLRPYLERAIAALRRDGITIDDVSLAHLPTIGWEHINLTCSFGHYVAQMFGRFLA